MDLLVCLRFIEPFNQPLQFKTDFKFNNQKEGTNPEKIGKFTSWS